MLDRLDVASNAAIEMEIPDHRLDLGAPALTRIGKRPTLAGRRIDSR
jgi:hypothetical protein